MPATNPSTSQFNRLAELLSSDPTGLTSEDVPLLLNSGLAGAMRARLPTDHPLRVALRPGHLLLGARHARIRSSLRPLLHAWSQAGIPALLFKGFALAEFEYGTPGERFYGDVDVLLPARPAVVQQAVTLAINLGWRHDGQHLRPDTWRHETAHLFSPDGQIRLDVHRFITAIPGGSLKRAIQLTQGVWASAAQVNWDGVPILRPHPLDAAVVNIALARCWGGDAGGLKAADYLDLECLIHRYQLTPAALEAHAKQLGGTHTWAAFRQVCSPDLKQFCMDQRLIAPLNKRAARHDGILLHRELWSYRLGVLRRGFRYVPQALMHVLMAWWAYRQKGDPRTYLQRWTLRASTKRVDIVLLNDHLAVIHWLTRLFYPRQRLEGICVPRAYASYRALRRLGHPAVFVSGVTRDQELRGHAWVEDDQGLLDVYGEPFNRQQFKVLFEYPTPTVPLPARPPA